MLVDVSSSVRRPAQVGLQGMRAGRGRPVGAEDAGSGPFHGGDNLLLRSLQDRGGCWRCVCGGSKGGCDLRRGHCAIIAEPGQPGWSEGGQGQPGNALTSRCFAGGLLAQGPLSGSWARPSLLLGPCVSLPQPRIINN